MYGSVHRVRRKYVKEDRRCEAGRNLKRKRRLENEEIVAGDSERKEDGGSPDMFIRTGTAWAPVSGFPYI